MQNGMTLNLAAYKEGKAAGNAEIVKVRGALHLTSISYHPATGEPQPGLVPISLKDAETQLEAMKADMAILEELIADMKNAREVVVPPQTPASPAKK